MSSGCSWRLRGGLTESSLGFPGGPEGGKLFGADDCAQMSIQFACNQEDIPERNQQVQHMHQNYARVVVWLGEPELGSELRMDRESLCSINATNSRGKKSRPDSVYRERSDQIPCGQ